LEGELRKVAELEAPDVAGDGAGQAIEGWALPVSELRSPRAAHIHSAVLAAILDHRLQPGARLPEDELASIYGVSRTIVRSALQALAHDRVVTIEPNRGAQIAEPSATEARQVFEARSIIEPRMAALAAERATEADAKRLTRHIREEEKAISDDNKGRAIALSGAFHLTIAEIAAQPILAGFVRELVSRSSLIIALYWRRHDAMCERHAHTALAEAIGAGDSQRAADLMVSHIVDLLSGLDLRPRPREQARLSTLLQGTAAE
jgi:DNA-binding GntR family transcriptional regulator